MEMTWTHTFDLISVLVGTGVGVVLGFCLIAAIMEWCR